MTAPDLVGLDIISQTLATKRSFGQRPPLLLNYHPRSDHHSNVACFGMAVDLMLRSERLRSEITSGKLVLGINEKLQDFGTGRFKTLDLVIGTPDTNKARRGKLRSLIELVAANGIVVTDAQAAIINGLPPLPVGPIDQARIATEAKAVMTEHVKAAPRLYDELTSSHDTVHGHQPSAFALGLVMINVAETFLSPTRTENARLQPGEQAVYNEHKQPHAALASLEKVQQLRIRGGGEKVGFDGLAVVMVDCDNDTSGFRLAIGAIDAKIEARFAYGTQVSRVAELYDGAR